MESPILKQIAKFLQDKKRYKRWLAVFVCLAVIVGFTTAAALKMRGRAMTHDERVLACKLEVHQHTEACYDQEKNIICGYADYAVHRHNEDCYDAKGGSLACTLPEVEAHQHTDACYQEAEALACGLEESEGHQHTDGCYTREQGELTCQAEEHTHTEECQGEDGTIICEKEEHTHTDECYEWDETLTCQQEESEGHTHTAECYQVQKTLVCQEPEVEVHTHGDGCYERVLITPDGQETVQDPEGNVGIAEKVLAGTANEELPEGRIEVRRTCGKLQVEEHTHTQENGCIEIHEVIDGTDLNPVEEPAESSEGIENGNEGQKNAQTPLDGTEEGNTIVKTFEGEGFTVTAEYKKDANIPDEAELRAEQITAESDGTHYAEREAEFKQNLDDENATMKALLKVGFYVGEEEIEPQSPVTLTVQLLGDDGLPEGTPMTIVHFAEEGAEKLEGSKAENDTTSFEMKGFSEIAIGYGEEEDTSGQFIAPQNEGEEPEAFYLKKSFTQNEGEFKMVFHIEGDIPLPDGVVPPTEEDDADINEDAGQDDVLDDSQDETDSAEGTGSEDEDAEQETEEDAGQGADAAEDADSADGNQAEESEMEEDTDVLEGEGALKGAMQDGNVEAPEESGETKQETEADQPLTGTEDTSSSDEADSADAAGTEDAPSDKNGISVDKLKFEVKELDNKSAEHKEIYKALEKHAKEREKDGETFLTKAFDYSLKYMGEKLDLSECEVKLEVTPTNELGDTATENVSEDSSEAGTTKPEGKGDVEINIVISGILEEAEVKDLAKLRTSSSEISESKAKTMKMELESGITMFAAQASGQANPKFTVQYYANLEKVAFNDDTLIQKIDGTNTNELPVIDTDGGKLPGNGKGKDTSPNGNTIRNLYVDTKTGKLKTKTELTEVYEDRPYEYYKAPTINYINALIENASYELKEVWVLKDGKNANSIEKGDWTVYPYNTNLHFTNRELSGGVEDGETYVYIKDNAVIRLVYDTTAKDKDLGVAFYDYDIGDGSIYDTANDAQNGVNGKPTSKQGTGKKWYMSTGQKGINSSDNYAGSGTKFAFGNSNSGSGLQHENWKGNLLNKNNSTQTGHPDVVGSYKGCTFGLASELVNGKIRYADGVVAPNLFNDGTAKGKTSYDKNEYSLKFNRVGDTHTLTAVNGTGTTGLDKFINPSPYSGKTYYHIWTNNFWPMDSASSYGTDGHDMKFGQYYTWNNSEHGFSGQAGSGPVTGNENNAIATGDFPSSDDGKNHNSYFGMHYKVEFDLVADYIGPLEYYFFGDDDMWVFLGDEDGNGKLVCDIGGVHSSVGEYLNLWDYIDKDKEKIHRHEETCYNENNEVTCGFVDSKKFTLNFFYTERGESGSTCWMQFTLPSVSSLTPETTNEDYGHLRVDKDVKIKLGDKEYSVDDFCESLDPGSEQEGFLKEKEFTFKLSLQGPSGTSLKDDYAYIKYDRNGKPISGEGGILAWETIANGESFTLKDGEYISIRYLPKGSTYTVEEIGGESVAIQSVVYDSTSMVANNQDGKELSGEYQEGGTGSWDDLDASGTIPSNQTCEVAYTNKYRLYELPKTGSTGTSLYTMAGVAVILLGAGFMYRKRFREGRVGGSS